MRALLVPLAVLASACASRSDVPLEAPDVSFQHALVVAFMEGDARVEVEEAVAAEIERRRPSARVSTTYRAFPDLDGVTLERFRGYVQRDEADLVVTIMPFEETFVGEIDEAALVSDELDVYVTEAATPVVVDDYGVRVVGWDTRTREPVYIKTSEVLVGRTAGPEGVATFVAEVVTREL